MGCELDIENLMLQFDQIEEKFGLLIKRCRSLEHENSQLAGKIKNLEEAIQEKTEAENRFAEQKEKIRFKIDGLLEKLDHLSETGSDA
jgi:chromosome segregation ATPase